MNKKNGNITQFFTLIVSLAIMLLTIMYVINMLTPFVWYQKLQNIAAKYVYVIERFGYLTNTEEQSLIAELKAKGFDIDNIKIVCPRDKKGYGELFEFEIIYKTKVQYGMWKEEIQRETKDILLHVKKYGYVKS